jgi:NhaP-type Na+/H+ or K+/H+ antiporter
MLLIAAFVLVVFGYSLASGRLERSVLTAPMLFTAAGVGVAHLNGTAPDMALDRSAFLAVAELGLVMTLFSEASRVRWSFLMGGSNLPLRLLSVGMLLTMLLGAACAKAVFPQLSWPEACILAAILAPTDAGLGQVIVSSRQVPLRVRQSLNVEAGLNDGLSVPFLLLFIALAAHATDAPAPGLLARYLGEQLGLGVLVGGVIGGLGGWLLGLAQRRNWMAPALAQMAVVALPLLCVLASEGAGASMFIAAFVAGLLVQLGFRHAGHHSIEFADDWGQLFDYAVFFLFGMVVALEWQAFTPSLLLYALLSLTLVRMLPVAVALRGMGLSRSSLLFIGWFGPRGLASIVLGLVYLEHEAHLPGESTIRLAVMLTVLLSIFAHGLSARPGIAAYARRTAGLGPQASEHAAVATEADAPPR